MHDSLLEPCNGSGVPFMVLFVAMRRGGLSVVEGAAVRALKYSTPGLFQCDANHKFGAALSTVERCLRYSASEEDGTVTNSLEDGSSPGIRFGDDRQRNVFGHDGRQFRLK